MAEAQSYETPTLAEQYLLKDKEEKPDGVTKPVEVKEVENPEKATSGEVASENTKSTAEKNTEVTPDASGEKSSEESTDVDNAAPENSSDPAPAASEESSETTEENSDDQEVADETPEIKIETAPADIRFPTTNQTRHCFTRYIEYHRCIAAKGDAAPDCDKFAKYYRSICPGEWIDNWNEQRENGTFPGPL